MKKWLVLLCLCLTLHGFAALAEEDYMEPAEESSQEAADDFMDREAEAEPSHDGDAKSESSAESGKKSKKKNKKTKKETSDAEEAGEAVYAEAAPAEEAPAPIAENREDDPAAKAAKEKEEPAPTAKEDKEEPAPTVKDEEETPAHNVSTEEGDLPSDAGDADASPDLSAEPEPEVPGDGEDGIAAIQRPGDSETPDDGGVPDPDDAAVMGTQEAVPTGDPQEPEESGGQEPEEMDEQYPEEPLPDEAGMLFAPEETAERGDGEADAGIPDDAEAWLIVDGKLVGGSLSDVIRRLTGNEVVYLRTGSTIHVSGAPLDIIAGVRFRPDIGLFGDGKVVRLYGADPDGGGEPVDFSNVSAGDTADVWFRVEDADDPSGDDGDDTGEYAISVSPDAFAEGEWINRPPTFRLSGIPEGKDWMYAVIIYNDRIVPLSGDTFRPTEDGVYTLQFVIQDELGDLAAVSEKLTPWFDWTKPRVAIEVSKKEDFTLNITATDALSGVSSLSLDGGKTWRTMLDGATCTYSAKSKTTLPAGQIRVMDNAGNVYISDSPYTLTSTKQASAMTKRASGSSGSSSSSGTDSHASDQDTADNGTLKLVMTDDPMRQLTIGGKALALNLMLEENGDVRPISFVGSLEVWYNENGRMASTPNLLALDACLDEIGDIFSCRWYINGEVFRILNNSGVDYVAFQVLGDVCVVPTAGFIGGARYTELKTQGISSRKFDYTLTMKVNRDINTVTALTENDFSEDCDFALRVDVENMGYEMSTSSRSPIYYHDVYLGPEEMLLSPFGQYDR